MTVMTTMSIMIVATVITITTTATMTTVKLGNIPQKPALSVVTSIDVSIGTEIISDSESNAYSADHPGHSKFNNSFKIKKHRYRESTERNKVGIYHGRGGHPPETPTALGYQTFSIYGHYRGHCYGHNLYLLTALYPSDSRSETASVTSVSILGNVRLEHSQPRLTKTDHCQVRGSLREPERYRRFCPSPNPIVRGGKGVPERQRRESECSFLSCNHGT